MKQDLTRAISCGDPPYCDRLPPDTERDGGDVRALLHEGAHGEPEGVQEVVLHVHRGHHNPHGCSEKEIVISAPSFYRYQN